MRTRVQHNDQTDYDHHEGASTDFDWETVYRNLGEGEDEIDPEAYVQLAKLLQRFLHWVLAVDLKNKNATLHIGRRFVALCWTLNPALFEGASLTQLAKQLGTHVPVLSAFTADASREFGVRNRSQAHGWNWKAKEKQKEKKPCK